MARQENFELHKQVSTLTAFISCREEEQERIKKNLKDLEFK